jgi:excisionase family DNA binding protein
MQLQGSPKPYRVAQVASILDVDLSTVYREIRAGRLRALRIGSGRGTYRITAEALNAYLCNSSTVPTSVEAVA